ncbi:MAG: hypothetical protein AAF827_14920 [Cyanobacteria bacterium P01_D01_bin.6]
MSGPYQSNILRFWIRQYRLGVERHRQAVRKTRSAVTTGVEAGVVVATALAMTPVYAAARMSRSAGRKLRQSVMKRRLSATVSAVVGRLRDSSGEERLVESSPSPKAESVAQKAAAGLVRTTPKSIVSVVSWFALKTTSIVRTAVGRLVSISDDESAITLASTQSSTFQPSELQSGELQSGELQSSDLQSGRLSPNQEKARLVRPLRSFWVALLEAVANLNLRWRGKRLKSAFAALPNAISDELPGSRQSRRLNSSVSITIPLAQCDRAGSLQPASDAVRLNAAANRPLDAKVTAFEYIEHPLEIALRWVDRILTRLESWWKILTDAWYQWRADTRKS